ncbi:MAG: OmpA family protein [Bacteroidales bacterium]|jgi:outer membrane protein OmpA-like peptidoglycan-associated protein/tetratricopeptide (TPR) repeat protein
MLFTFSLSKIRFVSIALTIFFLFIYKTASSQDEESPCKIDNKKAEKIFNKGISEMKSGNTPEAIKLFKETIDEEPGYVDAYYALGRIFLKKNFMSDYTGKSYIKSVKHYYKKVIELCPAYDLYVYYVLGDIYLGEDKLDSANYYMSQFIKDPDKIKKIEDFNHADSVVNYTRTMKQLTCKAVPFNPVYVKNISTPLDEYLPLISPDNEMALFVRKVKKEKSKNDPPGTPPASYLERFMYSERGNDGEFDSGKEMPYPFNTNNDQGAATITLDNNTLYFVFCELINLNKAQYYNCDICESERKNGIWGEIKNLGPKVNRNDSWESQPSISSDGKTLYFISDRPGGYGGYDIYMSTKDSSGNWTLAQNLGTNINTSGNEKTPYIHTDDQTLYFSSTGWPGLGGYDIFYSKKGPDGKFGKPINIGYPINTPADDVGFTVSTDGHYGYFASNKYNGPGGWDIYSFELYKGARPAAAHLVTGNIKDMVKNEPASAKLELKNVTTKKITEIPVDSSTGKYILAVLNQNEYIMTVKKDDYGYTSKYISKEDTTISTPLPLKVNVDFNIKPIAVGESYKLNDIHFAYGSAELTQDSKLIIYDFVQYLNDHPTMKVAIHGHTDNVSGADFNLKLSEDRAKSVYEDMIANGIDASRLSYKGFGLTKPVASNDTEEGRAMNRRTEFVIIEK